MWCPDVIKNANWSEEPTKLPKRTVMAHDPALPAVVVCALEEPINAIQFYKDQESKGEKMERHYPV